MILIILVVHSACSAAPPRSASSSRRSSFISTVHRHAGCLTQRPPGSCLLRTPRISSSALCCLFDLTPLRSGDGTLRLACGSRSSLARCCACLATPNTALALELLLLLLLQRGLEWPPATSGTW